MVFCFDNTGIDEVIADYNGLVSTGDVLVLSFDVAGKVNLPDELKGKSDVLLKLAAFSKRKQVIIVAGMTAETASKTYESAIVIDKGKILGVSDCINPQTSKIAGGVAFRRYATSMGRLTVFVGGDARYPELWGFADKSRYVICLCKDNTDGLLACARALAVYLGKYVLAVWGESKVCITPYGAISAVKTGVMTAFYLPMSLATGRRLNKRIKYVEEE